MKLQSLFITPIMITKSVGHENLVDRLYEIKKQDKKGVPKSNIGGWHSHDELYKDEKFKQITGDILFNAKECFKHLELQNNIDPELTGLWAIINPPGSRNTVHTHPYNFLSGVYYLKVPQKSGNLVFLDPRPQAEILSAPVNKNASVHLTHSVSYEPKDNDLIFFPSWLQHEVKINNSNKDRIILSFNIMWGQNANN